jgi:hypothetical protein
MYTTADIEAISWHDNAVHGFRIVEGADNRGGTLVFDIDFILEWLPGENGSFEFRIEPSALTFRDVTDLVLSVDYAASTAAVQPMTIHEIHRETIAYPNGYTSYKWRIEINWPPNSYFSFRSDGFTQEATRTPVTGGRQYLSVAERSQS